jgi:hypothetical protein
VTCITYPDGLTVCTSGPSRVIAQVFEEQPRWCFGCRKHVRYNLSLTGPIGPSYYEPTWDADCPNGCGDRASGGFWYVSWNGGEE